MNGQDGKRKMTDAKPRDTRPTVGLLAEVGLTPYNNILWAGFADAASKLDVNLNVSSVCDTDGNILYSRSILHDITKRKQIEGALRAGEERLQ